jgi:N-methylhydantoinase A
VDAATTSRAAARVSGISVGIDVGGTFTDLVAVDPEGRIEVRKVLSTREDQSRGVDAAVAALGGAGSSIERVVHGTTVVTNLLLERSGARVALCATEGASDLLLLRRQDRASLYDLSADHPPPLTSRDMTFGVPERISPEGVLRPLDASGAGVIAARVAESEPEIVAISLLHAYADDRHEQMLAAALAERLPGVDVVLSSAVLPEIREYERTSTTVIEAYSRPRVGRYLRGLETRLQARAWPAPGVMTSSGGMRTADDAAHHAASLALSGPAGGVVGAAYVARAAGIARALTIDIGGTSADAGLILDGQPLVEAGGSVAGLALTLPRVLVETVSAGGGSVGWVDDGGALRVGPRSAGATPGPAAFGRGGMEATVTDAHVVLGHITAGGVSGVPIDEMAARRAVATLAARLGADARATANAMLAAADAEMARALRRVGIERGIDPRDCTLIAFGGGGPLHACRLAERLEMRRVLVPPAAGVLSALGLALVAERREALSSVMTTSVLLTQERLAALVAKLRLITGRAPTEETWLRARYRGQGHELEVPIELPITGERIAKRFIAFHAQRFGFVLELPIEIISARHAASGVAREASLARRGRSTWSSTGALRDDGGVLDARVDGPASIALPDATLLVAPHWTASALPMGGWEMTRT